MKRILFTAFMLQLCAVMCFPGVPAPAAASVIVEQNLFHPERKKWLIEKKEEKKETSKPPSQIEKDMDNIELFGTATAEDGQYAVIRTKISRRKSQSGVYMVGDYVNGYLVASIEPKRVVLKEQGSEEEYAVYLNEGRKSRPSALRGRGGSVKTEIKPDPVRLRGSRDRDDESDGGSTTRERKKSTTAPKRAQTASFLIKRLKKDMDILKNKKSRLVRRQAEKDYKKLSKLIPHLSDQERREVLSLKGQLDALEE